MSAPFLRSRVVLLIVLGGCPIGGMNAQQNQVSKTDVAEQARTDEDAAKSASDFEDARTLYEGDLGRRIARGFEYDFQRVEQPTFFVTGTGALAPNPEHYLNEHTLKFQFSEVFPNTATLATVLKNTCSLFENASDCKEAKGIESLARAGGWWRRGLSGVTVTGDLSERAALQQGIVVTNPSFSNHYQLTGGIDFDPTQLFINGTTWTKAIDPFKKTEPFCRNTADKVACIRNLSMTRLKADYGSKHDTATSVLAAVVPTFSLKRVSQFDFVKNGGVLIPAPYLERAQTQLTLKWDLKKALPSTSAILDASAAKAKPEPVTANAIYPTRLCVVVSGTVSSIISVAQDFPAKSCAQFAAEQRSAYKLGCVGQKQITEGLPRHDEDPSAMLDTEKEACWIEKK